MAGNKLSDSELVAAYVGGDQFVLGELMTRHSRHLQGYLGRFFRYVDDDERQALIEDLIQETWIRVGAHAVTFDQTAKFTTWLYTIATNLAINALRDRKRRQRVMGRWPAPRLESGEIVELEIADEHPAAQPDTALAIKELERFFDTYSHLLPDEHREILVLRMHGAKYDEMASQLGIQLGTVKSRLARARAALWALWEEHGAR